MINEFLIESSKELLRNIEKNVRIDENGNPIVDLFSITDSLFKLIGGVVHLTKSQELTTQIGEIVLEMHKKYRDEIVLRQTERRLHV